MTTNVLSMVEQVLAGWEEYPHYLAVEHYYAGTVTGPAVTVYLSKESVVLTGASSAMVGSGVRVRCYTSTTTNLGAVRYDVLAGSGGNIGWSVGYELVLSDCSPVTVAGVPYDLPSAPARAVAGLNGVSALFQAVTALLLVFVLVMQSARVFRLRGRV